LIISFSVFKEKIESGEKTQTIRRYSDFQFNRFTKATRYQLYWGNPRNGGYLIKEVEKAENPIKIRFVNEYSPIGKKQFPRYLIYILNVSTNEKIPLRELAIKDGFADDFKMFDWFFEHYGSQMYEVPFMVLRWNP
jgi:hypothetical protein